MGSDYLGKEGSNPINSLLVTSSRTFSERTLLASSWPDKSLISRNGIWSWLKCTGTMPTFSKKLELSCRPFGKTVKLGIRELWALEYEIAELQGEFAKGIGAIDINNLTDDFVEDVMLQSKPLQGILLAIRKRQKDKMEEIKTKYWEAISGLDPLKFPRPPKPADEPKKAEEKKADAPAAPPAEAPAAPPPEAPKEVTASA